MAIGTCEDNCKAVAAVYQQLEDLADRITDKAGRTAEDVVIRLKPVLSDVPGRGGEPGPPQEAWPPHFAHMRSRLESIENYLDDIAYHIVNTGL